MAFTLDPRTAPTALLAVLASLALLAFGGAAAPAAHAASSSCSDTFEVPIEEDTGADDPAGPDDDVIEIALGARGGLPVVAWASCEASSRRAANPNPGFGVVPGRGTTPRRIFDERRDQTSRDVQSLRSARKKRAKRRG